MGGVLTITILYTTEIPFLQINAVTKNEIEVLFTIGYCDITEPVY